MHRRRSSCPSTICDKRALSDRFLRFRFHDDSAAETSTSSFGTARVEKVVDFLHAAELSSGLLGLEVSAEVRRLPLHLLNFAIVFQPSFGLDRRQCRHLTWMPATRNLAQRSPAALHIRG